MADKQPHLNGAYYGPAVPPAEPLHHSGRRERSCCCCLCGIIWKLLVAVIVLVGLAFLIFSLVVQPRFFKFYVTEAKLTQFDYANNNNLTYDLVLNFTARNPNKKLSIYYDDVEARAFYEGNWFDTTDVITHMNSFRQYKKSTDAMSGTFRGQQYLMFEGDDLSMFNEDKRNGVYDIYVRLYFRIRFRLGDFISGDSKPQVKCELRVPLSNSNGTRTTTTFESTECDVDF